MRMYTIRLLVLQLILFTALTTYNLTLSAKNQRVIVKYKENQQATLLSNSILSVTGHLTRQLNHQITHIKSMSHNIHVVEVPEEALEQTLNALNQDEHILYAEPDRMMHITQVPNDTRYNEQWHYFETTGGMNLPDAWDITTGVPAEGDDAIVVAVVDTGVLQHDDLSGQVLPGYDFISDTQIANDGDGRDNNASDPGDWLSAGECGFGEPATDRSSSWHGTHVAGTIAAKTNNAKGVAGVAWGAKILPVRTLGKCGGYTSDIIDGMRWAAGLSVEGVPQNPHPAKVINLSLGGNGACGLAYQEAIDEITAAGVVIVVAAGNDADNAANYAPASCDNVVTVAATTKQGSLAYYSNFGPSVEVSAPGGETRTITSNGVLSLLNSGQKSPDDDSYEFYQGTSMATPHVAGVVALMLTLNDTLNPTQVRNFLMTSARDFPEVSFNQCNTSVCGAGIIDAAAALRLARGDTPTPTDSLLENGVAKAGLSQTTGRTLQFKIVVPENATNLRFVTSGGSGDVDLFVKYEMPASRTTFDLKSERIGNADSVSISAPRAGIYYVTLYAYRSFADVMLLGEYVEPGNTTDNVLANGVSVSGLAANRGQGLDFVLTVPENASDLSFTLSGGTGDVDLFIRKDAKASNTRYEYRSENAGNQDAVKIAQPEAGVYHVHLYAYKSFEGVMLIANYNEGNSEPSDPFAGENTTRYVIPDNHSAGVESPIDVTRSGPAGDVVVTVDITHTYSGDLTVLLLSPMGTSYTLRNRVGGSQDDIQQTFTVNAGMTDSLGEWKLRVIDSARQDTGAINSWHIQFN